MKPIMISLAAAVALAGAAFAQGDASAIDANGDGMMSMEEMQAAYPDLTEETFNAIDANGDGSIDADELSAAIEAGTLPASDG